MTASFLKQDPYNKVFILFLFLILFRSLTKGITPKICRLPFVLVNSVLLNPFYVFALS